MHQVRVIPVLLLDGWGLWKSVRFADPIYIGSPINAVRVFNGFNVDELVILDIAATGEGRFSRQASESSGLHSSSTDPQPASASKVLRALSAAIFPDP